MWLSNMLQLINTLQTKGKAIKWMMLMIHKWYMKQDDVNMMDTCLAYSNLSNNTYNNKRHWASHYFSHQPVHIENIAW